MFKQFSKSILLVAAAAVLALAGCGSSISPEAVEKLEVGMSQAEVKAILGTPTKTDTMKIGPIETTTFTYESGKDTVVIQFMNDKAGPAVAKFEN